MWAENMKEIYKRIVDEQYGIIQKLIPLNTYYASDVFIYSAIGSASPEICGIIGYGETAEAAKNKAVEQYLARYFAQEMYIKQVRCDKDYFWTVGCDLESGIYSAQKVCIESAIKNQEITLERYTTYKKYDWIVNIAVVDIGKQRNFLVDVGKSIEEVNNGIEAKYQVTRSLYFNMGENFKADFLLCGDNFESGIYSVKCAFDSSVKPIMYIQDLYLCRVNREAIINE